MSITRTTVAIDDGLLATAKHLAAERHHTLGDLVTAALQQHIADSLVPRSDQPIVLPTSGRGGVRPGVNLSSNAEIAALLDEEDQGLWSSQM